MASTTAPSGKLRRNTPSSVFHFHFPLSAFHSPASHSSCLSSSVLADASLASALAAIKAGFLPKVPEEALKIIGESAAEIAATGVGEKPLKVGDKVTSFTLPDATGKSYSLSDSLSKGPVIINFYRGSWCPYCNAEISGYAALADEIAAAGATLVAISPNKPDDSLSTIEKHALKFPVLSDAGNAIARTFGLVFSVPEKLSEVYKGFGIDLVSANADGSLDIPIPATYVVDKDGTIKYAFASLDYTTRAEPSEVIAAAKALSS